VDKPLNIQVAVCLRTGQYAAVLEPHQLPKGRSLADIEY